MDLPRTDLDTPFNITRTSHVVLTVKDLEASRLFYTEVVGLIVTEQTGSTLYLRGLEEACHHSMVLKQSNDAPVCETLGMRVLREKDLDLLKTFSTARAARPTGSRCRTRAARCASPTFPACRVEFCASMTVVPRPLTQFHLYKGGSRAPHRPLSDPGAGRAQGLRVLPGDGFLADRISRAGDAANSPACSSPARAIRTTSCSSRRTARGCIMPRSRRRRPTTSCAPAMSRARSASATASSADRAGTGRGMRPMSICAIPTATGSSCSTRTTRPWTWKSGRSAGTRPRPIPGACRRRRNGSRRRRRSRAWRWTSRRRGPIR